MVPLMREKFHLLYEQIGIDKKEKYKRISILPLREKRIFGILTAHQTGHIPNLQISFTQDEENFNRDTYLFKSLAPDCSISIDVDKEIYKQNGVNEYRREDISSEETDQTVEPGTINQIETFHKWLMSDIFKRHKVINYAECLNEENRDKTKKYYIVPLKIDKGFEGLRYQVDSKILEKVEKLSENGYKNEQESIMKWLANKNFASFDQKIEKLSERILVKEDKPSNCYTYCRLLDDLRNTKAETVAEAIKGKPENLNCSTGFELIFEAPTRFNCIKSFRDLINEKNFSEPGYKDKIM